MENKDTKEYKYDAFISYRHAKLDQFVAENLHKLLEMFKVPYIAADSVKKQKKNKINRVFRDRDELPLSSNLSENIQNALETSEFLIVICSPRTPESLWVQKEISTFISLHGREKVLAVLIEGEPEQSFPRELCFEQVEKILEDGTTCTVEQVVEPLAADVRGKNKKEVYKNLKKELLRLAAPLLGCSYDDLKQRHRERRIKRMMMASVAVATIFLVFGSISMAMALQIKKQSVMIQEQSEEIEKQYQEVLKRQAQTLADTATQLLEEGNRVAAVQVAKEALTEMPYTEQAQYALTEALRVYENGDVIMPVCLLKMGTDIDFFHVSPKGEKVLTVDITGQMTVWEAAKGKKLYSLASESKYGTVLESEYAFFDETHIIFQKKESIVIYDIELKEEVLSFPYESHYVTDLNESAGIAAVADDCNVYVIDTENYTVKTKYTLEEWYLIDEIMFNESGTLLACNGDVNADLSKIIVLDTSQNKYVSEMVFDEKEINDILFIDDEHLAVSKSDTFSMEGVRNATVELWNADNGVMQWVTAFGEELPDELLLLGNQKELACQSYYGITTLSVEDGQESIKTDFDNEITGCIPLGERNMLLMLRSGKTVFLFGDTGEAYDYSINFQTNSENMCKFRRGANFYATLPYGSNTVAIYQSTIGAQAQSVAEYVDTIWTIYYDRTGETYLVLLYGNSEQGMAYLIDAKTHEKLAGFEMDTMINAAFFIGENDEQIGILTSDALFFYDRSGNCLRQMDLDAYGVAIASVSEDGKRFVLRMDGVLKCFETATLEMTSELPLEDLSTIFAMGEHQKFCIMISEEKEELQVFDFHAAELVNSIPINSSFISNIFTDEEEQLIFVTYRDNTVEVYDREKLELQHTFTGLNEEMVLVENLKGNDTFIMYGITETYLCKKNNFEIIARIPGYMDVAPDAESLLASRNKVLVQIPVYGVEQLLQEAERQLDGRILSEEERERYHLGTIPEDISSEEN